MSDEYIAKLVRKAVDVNTLPDTTPTSTQIRNIHSFLSNPQYVDTAYRKIAERADASAKKLELKVLVKCVKLLKRSLVLYHPNHTVLGELDRLCRRLHRDLNGHEIAKSFAYIRSLIDSISLTTQSNALKVPTILVDKKKMDLKVRYDRSTSDSEIKSMNTEKRKHRHKKSSGGSHGNKKRWRNNHDVSLTPDILLSRQKPTTILSTPETFTSTSIFGGQFEPDKLSSYKYTNDLFVLKDVDVKNRLMAIILSKKNDERQFYKSFRRQPPLFQFNHYKDQYRLELGSKTIEKVVTAAMNTRHDDRLVASKILIKLIMDMLCVDPRSSQFMIENIIHEMLDSKHESVRVHALNLLFNVSVHVNMYEEVSFFGPHVEESQPYINIQKHQEMLYHVVQNVLLSLVHRKEKSLAGLDPRVICGFLKNIDYISEPVWRHLIRILTNILYLYQPPDSQLPSPEFFSFLCLIGSYKHEEFDVVTDAIEGIKYIIELYMQSHSYEARDNLFSIIFDYLHCCHINRVLLMQNDPENIKEEELVGYHRCFKVLVCMDASQQFPQLFKCPVPNFVDASINLIKRVSLSNSYFKTVLESVDINLLHKVLNDFYHLAQHCLKLDISNKISPKSNLKTLYQLLHSNIEDDLAHGELHLTSWMKRIWTHQFGLSKNATQKSWMSHVKEFFDEIPKSNNPYVRAVGLRVLDRGIIFLKRYSETLSHEKVLSHIYDMLNMYIGKYIEHQEQNEQNLMIIFDMIFNLIHIHPMPTHEIYNTSEGIISEKISQDDYVITTSVEHERDLRVETTMETPHVIRQYNTKDLLMLEYNSLKIQHQQEKRRTTRYIDVYDLTRMDDSSVGSFLKGNLKVSISLLSRVDIHILLYIFNNLPQRYTSQLRVAMLHLIIQRCKENQHDLEAINGSSFFKRLLSENDPQISYLSSRFLVDKLQNEQPDQFHTIINTLLSKAVEVNDEKIVSNPYLQIKEILEMKNSSYAQ